MSRRRRQANPIAISFQWILRERLAMSLFIACAIGTYLHLRFPWHADNYVLSMIHFKQPEVYKALFLSYTTFLFTTPLILVSAVLSTAYIFLYRPGSQPVTPVLPPFPNYANANEPVLVLGEVHHLRRAEPVARPRWLTIPSRGLHTGIAIFGAIGSGKTSSCILPWMKQLVEYRANSGTHRIGGLVLEVKGDLCKLVRRMLHEAGRDADYVEIGFNSDYRYNPLHNNDLDAYTFAYGIASLMNNLFGKGKEPFWQQAYTNMVKFIILLHRILFDYVTLFDIYECAISPRVLAAKLDEAEQMFNRISWIEIPKPNGKDLKISGIDRFGFDFDPDREVMRARASDELKQFLRDQGITDAVEVNPKPLTPSQEHKRLQYQAIRRWFHEDWMSIDTKLRTSIVEGISVFLSLFDDNPAVKRLFCPPKEMYDRDSVAPIPGDPYGIPLPPFSELIEKGKICCLNFPVALNPGLAKAIGTMMKLDFQRAALLRIPAMEAEDADGHAAGRVRHFRDTMFVCDEYQHFATVGGNDPNGDEKFFSLSRQAKCIPIVATQSISSLKEALPNDGWRTLLQTFRTKVFLAQSDEFSIQAAASLCGKEDRIKVGYSVSEASNDARVSLLTGKTASNKSTLTTSKNYTMQKDFIFDERSFALLKNAQAIVMPFDGVNQLEPCYVYLKPWFLARSKSYWEQLEDGEL